MKDSNQQSAISNQDLAFFPRLLIAGC